MAADAISFGPFRLLLTQRLLLEGDNPVRLGSRAFDILAALVERPGEVVGKNELIARAWPQTVVEDANLKIQVSALRRALGDGQGGHRYVVTVPGRGYNFVAQVRREERSGGPFAPTSAPPVPHNLPFAATRMIGRDDALAAVTLRLSHQRLVTIIGPGGIGKTTVALAVAERMIAGYEHGVWLIDLAPVGDPRLVPTTVASVLGLEVRTEDHLADLVADLKDRRMLLLLDNCEHVIDQTAALATAVLNGALGVNILATSREPLGVAGEREHRLRPLGAPLPSAGLTAAEAATFPAVQLFIERATAVVENFALTDGNALPVVEICRRLDGLPLAIEFAASRVEVLGVEGLAAHLGHSLTLLRARGRAGVPRHQTMRAVVDWSYGLLGWDDQLFFRALGIFSGGFGVEAVAAMAGNAATAGIDAIDRLADLVAKSLVVVDLGGAKPRFRLLDTTRAYAIEKLDESGERESLARRHAEYYRNLFERAGGEGLVRPEGESPTDYSREIDNLRAALDWAYAQGGDLGIAVELTAAAAPLWLQMSLIEECRARAARALAVLEDRAIRDDRRRMKLYVALAQSQMYSTASLVSDTITAWAAALNLADGLNDTEYRLRALWGLWGTYVSQGEFRQGLVQAKQFSALATKKGERNDQLVGDRLLGGVLHFLGDQKGAKGHIDRMLEGYAVPAHRFHLVRFQSDQRITGRMYLVRVLWLLGLPDQALQVAEANIDDAIAINHSVSLCNALAGAACPVAILSGDLAIAERYTKMLAEQTSRAALEIWHMHAECFEGELLVRRGDPAGGIVKLRTGVTRLLELGFGQYLAAAQCALATALMKGGDFAQGLSVIEEALRLAERGGGHWCTAELLRVRGMIALHKGEGDARHVAETHFLKAIRLARQQHALAWELRAATSLAELKYDQGLTREADQTLRPVYERFSEGYATDDLITAKRLLDAL
jgi:predicted ATPase/DNA-binding winged helix-turn-helix (wHTH) protein